MCGYPFGLSYNVSGYSICLLDIGLLSVYKMRVLGYSNGTYLPTRGWVFPVSLNAYQVIQGFFRRLQPGHKRPYIWIVDHILHVKVAIVNLVHSRVKLKHTCT